LILTLLDHASYGVLGWILAGLPSYWWVIGVSSLSQALEQSLGARGELGRQFTQAGGFPMLLVAAAVGFMAGVVRYHGWDFRPLRFFKLTNRTGNNLVWAEVLTKAPGVYAVVACKDGSRFMGWIDTFSEEAENYEIYLSRASQLQVDGTSLPISGPGVLLTRENPIVRVELWNPT
jgi:hypothetical protein